VSKNIIILNAVITFSSVQALADTANPIDIDLNRVKLIRETENFLTNPVLEAFRKLDQLESDESFGNNKAILLYPIIDISKDIENIKMKLEYIQHETNDDKILTTLNDINSILSSNKYMLKNLRKFLIDIVIISFIKILVVLIYIWEEVLSQTRVRLISIFIAMLL